MIAKWANNNQTAAQWTLSLSLSLIQEAHPAANPANLLAFQWLSVIRRRRSSKVAPRCVVQIISLSYYWASLSLLLNRTIQLVTLESSASISLYICSRQQSGSLCRPLDKRSLAQSSEQSSLVEWRAETNDILTCVWLASEFELAKAFCCLHSVGAHFGWVGRLIRPMIEVGLSIETCEVFNGSSQYGSLNLKSVHLFTHWKANKLSFATII